MGVALSGGDQLRVRSPFDNSARIQDQNLIGVHDGGETVRNHQCRATARGALDAGLNGFFRLGVE